MRSALVNGRVFDGENLHDGLVVVLDDGRIAALVPQNELPTDLDTCWDMENRLLAPGLIDLQVNGGGGVMFNDDPGIETIRRMGAAHRRFGTTGFLPTLISSDAEIMKRAIEAVGQAIDEGVPGVLGVHLEGPYLNPDKRGIHDESRFCQLNKEAFELLTSLELGKTVVTLAPELTSGETITRSVSRGPDASSWISTDSAMSRARRTGKRALCPQGVERCLAAHPTTRRHVEMPVEPIEIDRSVSGQVGANDVAQFGLARYGRASMPDVRNRITRFDDAFRQQEADREFVVVSRRPHRDRDALFLACTGRSIPESNLQWLLDGDDIVGTDLLAVPNARNRDVSATTWSVGAHRSSRA